MTPSEEAVRELYRTWNEAGVEAMVALMHPDASWSELQQLPGAQRHCGRDAVLRALRDLVETVGKFTVTVEATEEIDSEVLAALHLHGTATPGGVPIDYRVIHMHRLSEGSVDRIRVYSDRQQAIAACT